MDPLKVKKSKKTKSSVSSPLSAPAGEQNAPASPPDGSHSKKRKRDRQLENSTSVDTVDTTEKKKKKTEKEHESSEFTESAPLQSAEHATTDLSAEALLRKKEKKEKKAKKKLEQAQSSPVAASEPKITVATGSTSKAATAYLEANSITIDSPDSPITPALSFDELDLDPKLRKALGNFKQPTPIQACAWPALLSGHDVIGIAETGSGKTMAFGLPALAHLTASKKEAKPEKGKKKNITVLVVAPTRELALQTHETMEAIGKPFGIKSVCVFGGVDKLPQKKLLATPDVRIVVGTPGRLMDLANEGACDLSGVTYLVLDEADRMLDKGFENDIRTIIGQTAESAKRQTLMFSATWPESVRRLASTFLSSPVRITVGSDDLTANARVVQSVEVFDDPHSKDKRLHSLLKTLNHGTDHKGNEDSRILIFVLYKREADRVLETLKYIGFTAAAIHGDMNQAARMKSLDEFKTGKTGLLVATDVAARGLDIPNVAAVINYSFPLTIEDYIHRIGRTGRGGKNGKSFTFFTGEKHERALAGELARVLRESGFDTTPLQKFPMTLKKKEHSAYGAFFRDDIPATAKPTKIKF